MQPDEVEYIYFCERCEYVHREVQPKDEPPHTVCERRDYSKVRGLSLPITLGQLKCGGKLYHQVGIWNVPPEGQA